MSSLKNAYQAKSSNEQKLLDKRNVIGAAIGQKEVNGVTVSDQPIVSVLVEKKLPLNEIDDDDRVPPHIDGVQTDVISVGSLYALDNPRKRYRPIKSGVSIGHPLGMGGTLGGIVYDRDTDEPLMLSNNHVLASSNMGRIGDGVYQPSLGDGAAVEDRVGSLYRYAHVWIAGEGAGALSQPVIDQNYNHSISFWDQLVAYINALKSALKTKMGLNPISKVQLGENYIDAAVARFVNRNLLTTHFNSLDIKVGRNYGASIGLRVMKSGRSTGLTYGTVRFINATVYVNFQDGIALFKDQIVTTDMSEPGDSGSLVLTAFPNDEGSKTHDVIGLLFAGSEHVSIMNPVDAVLRILNVSLHPSNF